MALLRRRWPWSQRELARAAGISVGTVRAIEHGLYKTVRPRVIRALAAALGVEPAAVAEFRSSMGLPPASDDPGGAEQTAAEVPRTAPSHHV